MRQLLFSLLLIAGCVSKKLPEGILEPEKMQSVFWDYIAADVYVTDYLAADKKKVAIVENAKLQKQIFEKHKTTKDQFYRSYEYYVAHPELMRNMIDTMLVRKTIKKYGPEKLTLEE